MWKIWGAFHAICSFKYAAELHRLDSPPVESVGWRIVILWRASGCHHERRPGDARDVSWDELCHLGMAGTGDRKDHPKGGGEGEPQAGSDRRKREPHRPGLSCCPTGKLSRGNVKTTKSCHNGNYLGGSRNPHEMSGLGVIAPEASGLTGSYCECTPLQVIWC